MCSLSAPEAGALPVTCAFMAAGAWVYGWVGDVTATAQGEGVCVTYGDSTRTKDPLASYVGRTSGLAASRPMLLKKTLSPRLLLQHSVHVEQSFTSVCASVWACVVRVYKLRTSLCVICLGWEAAVKKKKWKNRLKKLKRKCAQEETAGVKRRSKTHNWRARDSLPAQLQARVSFLRFPHGVGSGHTCTCSDRLMWERETLGPTFACMTTALRRNTATPLQIVTSQGGIFFCVCVNVCRGCSYRGKKKSGIISLDLCQL